MRNKITNLLSFIQYLKNKITYFRIYHYFKIYDNKNINIAKNTQEISMQIFSTQTNITNNLESTPKNEDFYQQLLAFKDLDSINLDESKKKYLAKREICVLLPSFLHSCNIEIDKSEVLKNNDRICLLNARKKNKISANSESRFYTNGIKKDCINFQIFSVDKNILSNFAKDSKQKMYFLNPFEIFSMLYFLYPSLQHFSIVFQDKSHHSLCHYSRGLLSFNVILPLNETLQDFYNQIDVLGSIFYVDFGSGLENECMNLKNVLQMPTDAYLKAFAFSYLKHKGLESSFYASAFYRTKIMLKMMIYSGILLLLFFIFTFMYNENRYNSTINYEVQNLDSKTGDTLQKKKNYTAMYDRIYHHVATKKSLNFSFQDSNILESSPKKE